MILARGRFFGRALLNALVLLPLVLPPVVTGYVLLLLFGRHGPLGRWLDTHLGIVFAFRWTGAALACAIMGFPLMVRAIQLSAAAVDRKLEQAAGTLGANPAYVFLTVTLPLMARRHHRRRHCLLRARHWRQPSAPPVGFPLQILARLLAIAGLLHTLCSRISRDTGSLGIGHRGRDHALSNLAIALVGARPHLRQAFSRRVRRTRACGHRTQEGPRQVFD